MVSSPRTISENRLITSQGVILDIYPAEVITRGLARIIDSFVINLVIATVLIAIMMVFFDSLSSWVGISIVLIVIFSANYGYHLFFNMLMGTTPGKRIFGLAIMSADGGPASFRQYAAREFIGLGEFQMTGGAAAVIAALISPRAQRLGDLAANTIVVHTKAGPMVGTSRPFFWQAPPGSEPLLAGMDISGLTPEEITQIRLFLLRSGRLHPQARAQLATRHVDLVRSKAYIPALPVLDDEALLATVMVKVNRQNPPKPVS